MPSNRINASQKNGFVDEPTSVRAALLPQPRVVAGREGHAFRVAGAAGALARVGRCDGLAEMRLPLEEGGRRFERGEFAGEGGEGGRGAAGEEEQGEGVHCVGRAGSNGNEGGV